MIVAVLARHAGVPLGAADVFVNVAGGVRIDEPGADLADRARDRLGRARAPRVKDGLAAFGELGLTGRLRPAAQAERRLEECAKLGDRRRVAPEGTRGRAAAPRVVRRGDAPAGAPGRARRAPREELDEAGVTRADCRRRAVRSSGRSAARFFR